MKTVVSVVGLGRIGLPIALSTAAKVRYVFGVDVDPVLVQELKRGHIRLNEPGLRELFNSCRERFEPTSDLQKAMLQSNVLLCCVGTRRFAENRPNLRVLWRIIKDLAQPEIKDKLIVLKTTVPIGTTRELANYIEKTTGMRIDRDFYMAFSPERTVEGKAVEELRKLPVIVGAVGEESLQRALQFYRSTEADVVNVGNAEAAELVKLVDNSYRITKFAFSNDISLIAERIGVDSFKVIEAANYRYPRNDIPYPSCGVSGYCLTKDPHYLEEAFRAIRKDRGFSSIWMNARRSYDYRVKLTVAQIEQFLLKKGTRIGKSRALVCGIAFKSNIDDIRDSHGIEIARELVKKGAQVSIWDPWIKTGLDEFPMHNSPLAAFKAKDVAIFTVAHKQFFEVARKIRRLTTHMRIPLIYDGAGIFRQYKPTDDSYYLIGTGYPADFDRQTSPS